MRYERRDGLAAILLFLAAVGLQLLIYDRQLGWMDEGYTLQLADEVLRGRALYRDVVVEPAAPGVFYTVAALFALFGHSVNVARAAAVAAFALAAALVYAIVRRLTSRGWALGVGLAFVGYRLWGYPAWHIFTYPVPAHLLVLAAALLAMTGLGRQGKLGYLAAAGLAAGMAAVYKQDIGGAALAMLGGAMLVAEGGRGEAKRRAVAFALPAAAFGTATAGAFAAAGALGPMFHQTVVSPLRGALSFGYLDRPALRPFFCQDPELRAQAGNYFPSLLLTLGWWNRLAQSELYRETAVLDAALRVVYHLPDVAWWGTLALWAADRWRGCGTSAERNGLLVIAALAGAGYLGFNRPRDWAHLAIILSPAIPALGVLAARSASAVRAPWRKPLRRAFAASLALELAVAVALAFALRAHMATPFRTERARLTVNAAEGKVLGELLTFLARHPEADPLPVLPYHPLVNFLAARSGVAGIYLIWPVKPYPDRDERIVAALEAHASPLVVYSFSQYLHLGRFADNAPVLYRYLAEHYRIERVFSADPRGIMLAVLARQRPQGESVAVDLREVFAPDGGGGGPIRRAYWPFAPVLDEEPLPAPRWRRACRVLDVPRGARLRFAAGVNPEHWQDVVGSAVSFRVTLARAGREAVLYRRTLDPRVRIADRTWDRRDLHLPAGRAVLCLATSAASRGGARAGLAGWARPRIVVPATPAAGR